MRLACSFKGVEPLPIHRPRNCSDRTGRRRRATFAAAWPDDRHRRFRNRRQRHSTAPTIPVALANAKSSAPVRILPAIGVGDRMAAGSQRFAPPRTAPAPADVQMLNSTTVARTCSAAKFRSLISTDYDKSGAVCQSDSRSYAIVMHHFAHTLAAASAFVAFPLPLRTCAPRCRRCCRGTALASGWSQRR